MKDQNLRRQIRNLRESTGIGWEIIEQDYILSWVLFGISSLAPLKSTLIFKGGTALKKCYFGDYRFSQDLDFSVQGEYPSGNRLFQLIEEACQIAQKHSDDVDFQCKKYPEKSPHPEGQEAFVVNARLPWQRDFSTSIKVEVTTKELIVLPPQERLILHQYNEELNGKILTYQVEEIIAEKIRAILQFAKKLHERGWGRSRVRDYYDLWRIFNEYGPEIKKEILPSLVQQKCAIKDVNFSCVADLFQKRLLEFLEEWNRWLEPIVPVVPEKDLVIEELKKHLHRVFL